MEYYDEQYEKLEKQLSEEAQTDVVHLESYKSIEKLLSGDWHNVYNVLDYAHKKTFWKRIIKEIYVDENTHKICGFDFLLCRCSN